MIQTVYLILLSLTACAVGGHALTSSMFQEIPVGTSTKDIEASAGKPYAIHRKDDGSIEYEYIERLKIGGRDAEIRHFYFVIRNGQVVSKRIEQSSPVPYLFDSYDMQTTQKNIETND